MLGPDLTEKILDYSDLDSLGIKNMTPVQISNSRKRDFFDPDSLGFKILEACLAFRIWIVAF